MGIQGLLPFLKDATQQVNVRKYSGYTVAVDTYCWIHRGAFGCAMQLAKGEQTDMYVRYCLKFINMLRGMDIKPILVFDGSHLPAKKAVEESRRERRELYSKKGKQFLREGKASEARDCFTKCVNVTPHMALEVIKAARSLGVDCIVAPYEADAQLAYLAIRGIAQAVITEDSDLVAFGCPRIIYKVDLNGNGLEVQASRLNKAMKMGDRFSADKFRYMCIASGCDYLPSLPGIGLGKAKKLFQAATNPDLTHVLKRLPVHLKMKLTVTQEYIDGFIQANNTFLYQLAFDPMQRRLVPLHPYGPGVDKDSLAYAGAYCSSDLAFQQALGNLDPGTKEQICDFKPEYQKPYDKSVPRHRLSIWHRNYRPGPDFSEEGNPADVQRHTTKGKEVSVKVNGLELDRQTRKRPRPDPEDNVPSIDDLTSIYGSPSTKRHSSDQSLSVPETPESDKNEQNRASPRRRNLFSQSCPQGDSPQRAEERVARNLSRRNIFAKSPAVLGSKRLQMLKGNIIVKSRFFATKQETTPQESAKDTEKPTSLDRESPNNLPSCRDGTSQSEDERKNKDMVPDLKKELEQNVYEVIKTSTVSALNRLQRFQRSASTSSLPSLRSQTTFSSRKEENSDDPEEPISLLDSDSNHSTSQENSQSFQVSQEPLQELSQVSRTAAPQGGNQTRRGAFSWSRSTSSLKNLKSGSCTKTFKSLNNFRRQPGRTRLVREGSQSQTESLNSETSIEDLSQGSSIASVNMYSIDADSISLSQLSSPSLNLDSSQRSDSQSQEIENQMSTSCSESLQGCPEDPEVTDKQLLENDKRSGDPIVHVEQQRSQSILDHQEFDQGALPNPNPKSQVEIGHPGQNQDSNISSCDQKFQQAVGFETGNQSERSDSKMRTSAEKTSSSPKDEDPRAISDTSSKAVEDEVCIDLTSDSDENFPPVTNREPVFGCKPVKVKMTAETVVEITPKLPNVPKLKMVSTKVNQCKASGLSRRKVRHTPKTDENSGGGPKQQTLFAFMKKNSKQTSEGSVIKPLSPAKENIIYDVTPDSDNSIGTKSLIRVQRNIFQ